jgi:hypothetical protein
VTYLINRRRGAFAPLAAVTVLSAAAAIAVSAPAGAQNAHGAGQARLTGRSGYLVGVSVAATNNVWAVGFHNPLRGPLILHKLHAWRTSKAPSKTTELVSVSASKPTDIWAVGDSDRSLALHWNGHRWTRLATPSPGVDARFLGVDTLAPDDAWAVGGFLNDNAEVERTLTAHWNGHKWTRVASPSQGYADLASVSFANHRNGWAVGERLVLHWNGTAWVRVKHPKAMRGLTSVYALSPTNAWAVGSSIYHWNGTAWSAVSHPGGGLFAGVTATSRTDAWAVGRHCRKQHGCTTLTLHWNGSRWSQVASPNPVKGIVFSAVDALNPHNVWAVGYGGHGPAGIQVALHWDGKRWHTA